MGDELDDVLDQPDPNLNTGRVDDADDADKITLTKAELENLKSEAAAGKEALTKSQKLENDLTNLQADLARNQQQPPANNGEFDWTKPDEEINKRIAAIAGPYARTTAETLANMAIATFESGKVSHPFYTGAIPIWRRELAGINKAWLGGLESSALNLTLEKAWSVAVGEYVEAERAKRKKPTGINLSGGSSGGGGGTGGADAPSKLQDIDPVAYRMAVNAGLSEEDMDKIAKEAVE